MRKAARTAARIVAGALALGAVTVILALLGSLTVVVAGFGGNAKLPADCGVVFGAAVYGYATPGPAIVRRVSTAARLYREGKLQKLILTGGVGRGEGSSLSEATVMRAQAISLGVQVFDIITEESSHSTGENLSLSLPLAKDCKSTVGISDAYHLTRIRLLAKRAGWQDFGVIPADERPQGLSELRSIIREVFAVLYYGLRLDTFIDIGSWTSMAHKTLQTPWEAAKLLT